MKRQYAQNRWHRFCACILVMCVLTFLHLNIKANENRAEEIVRKIISGETIQQQSMPSSKNTAKQKEPSANSDTTNSAIVPSQDIKKIPQKQQMPQQIPHDAVQEKTIETAPSADKGDIKNIEKDVISDAQQTAEKKKKTDMKGRTTIDEALYKAGIDYFNANLFAESIKSFEELKSKYSDSPRLQSALTYMGKAYMRLGDFSKAVEILTTVSPESGEYPASLFYLAESQISIGKRDDAISNLYRLSIQYPQTSFADDALLRLSQIFLEEQKGHQSLEAAVKIIQIYPDRETIDDAYFMIGQIYEKDPTLRDFEISRKIYRIFLQKAKAGEKFFCNSPLKKRVARELRLLEKRYFRHEQ